MLPIATEVFTVTERASRKFTATVNHEFFAANKVKDPGRYLNEMLILARRSLLKEVATVDRRQTVSNAGRTSCKDEVFSARFFLDGEQNLHLLVYFGTRTSPDKNYLQAVIHVLEVFGILETDLTESSGATGRKFGGPVVSSTVQVL